MTETVHFLCGNYKGVNIIYGMRFDKHSWHYFDESHILASKHSILPDRMQNLIGTLEKPKSIQVPMTAEQMKYYFSDGKFIFKNTELQTRLAFVNKNVEDKPDNKPSKGKSIHDLAFISGQTNPLLFINEFEKCADVKTDKEKMLKIRNFVDDSHRAEYSELYFVSDWETMRTNFLKKYSKQFCVNKKKELSINFHEEISVRLFVERKLQALSAYTTLPFVNQMEIVLNEMPCEIANLYIINDMLTGPKSKILEFSDSIKDIAVTMREKPEEFHPTTANVQNQMNELEVFHFDQEHESSDQQSMASSQSAGRGRGRGRGRGNRLTVTMGSDITGESTNSQSSDQHETEHSNVDSSPQNRSKTKRNRGVGRIVQLSTRKKLKTIKENNCSEDSMDTE